MRTAAVVTLVAALLGFTCGRRGAAAQTVDGEAVDEVVWVQPSQLLKVVEGTSHSVQWFTTLPNVASVTAQVEDERVAQVDAVSPVLRGSPTQDNYTFTGFVNVSTSFLGYNKLHIYLYDGLDSVVGEVEVSMSVLLSYQALSDLFMVIISIFVALLYVIMGATLDIEVLKMIIKKPFGPMVGIACQYIFMPLIAYGLAKATFPDNPLGQLGLFLGGSCPGGGASNMWTHLLGGSLDLSIMMTFISTVTAFAAVPLWVLMMGPTIVGAEFVIPYKDIMVLVFSLSFPCVIGMFITKFLPRVGKLLGKLLTPVTLFIVVFMFTFGVYSNLYVFSLFEVKTMFAGFGLPTLGYLSGLGLASLLRLPFKDRIAISIETGVQNMTIAIVILKLTLEAPASELTVVFPAAAVIMTPIPLVVALIVRRVYLWRRGPQEEDEKAEKAKETNVKGEIGDGKAEEGGLKAVKDGVKTNESGGEKKEADGGKVERNGSAGVVMGGIDNPGVEVEDTF